MSFNRSIADLLEYRRTRFPVVRFLGLTLFLAFAASSEGEHTSLKPFAVRVALVFLWLFQFRLGDDLADRQRDRSDHPDRVLARADGRPFVWLLLALTALNVLLTGWLLSVERGAEFLGLIGMLVLWYGVMPYSYCPLLASAGVLLKYPAFVYLLSDPSAGVSRSTLVNVLVVVYACFLIYELLHEKRHWSVSGISVCLALAMLFMTAAAVRLVRLHEAGNLTWWLFDSLGISCVVLAWLFRRHWLRREPGPWPEAAFLVASLWLACSYFR